LILCLLLVGRRKKGKKEKSSGQGLLSQGQRLDTPYWQLLGTIKG
jgi:hypothetical protein